jgi:hypothetical protein
MANDDNEIIDGREREIAPFVRDTVAPIVQEAQQEVAGPVVTRSSGSSGRSASVSAPISASISGTSTINGIQSLSSSDLGFGDLNFSLDQFALDPQIIQDIRDQTNKVLGVITGAMGEVSALAAEGAVDVGALTGRLEESFDTTKNLIMNSAMASSAKASFELEAFLGSTGSDARSAVRRGMSAQMTNNILNTTQQNIATLYSGHVNNVVETSLRGGEINAQVKIAATRALGDLASQAGQLILGTNSAILSSFSQGMDLAVALINAQTQRLQIASSERMEQGRLGLGFAELTLKEQLAQLNAETQRVTSPVWQKALKEEETTLVHVGGFKNLQKRREDTGRSTGSKFQINNPLFF